MTGSLSNEQMGKPIAPGHPIHVDESGNVVGQLPMFMTAAEIRESHQALHGDYMPGETQEGLFQRKLAEAQAVPPHRSRSLAESIQEEGVRSPVQLGTTASPSYSYSEPDMRPEILGGHHRIAASEEHDPDRLMPVLFYSQEEQPGTHHDFYAARMDTAYPYTDTRTDAELRAQWRNPAIKVRQKIGDALRSSLSSSWGLVPGESSSFDATTMTRTNTSQRQGLGVLGGAFGALLSSARSAGRRSRTNSLPPPPPERRLV